MSVFEVLNRTVCVQLSFSLWTPWRRLLDSDYGEISKKFPPSNLATRGAIKICDGAIIRPLLAIRRTAERACDQECVRFLTGYATHEDRANLLIQDLNAISARFARRATSFRDGLPAAVDAWVLKHPQWEAAIRAKAPGAIEDAQRIGFTYQLFRVVPPNAADPSAIENRGLATVSTGLSGQLFREIVAAASHAWKESFEGKDHVGHKALRPIQHLRKKLDALSYIDPHCVVLIERIDRVLASLPKRGVIENEHLSAVIGLLHVLSDEGRLRAAGSPKGTQSRPEEDEADESDDEPASEDAIAIGPSPKPVQAPAPADPVWF